MGLGKKHLTVGIIMKSFGLLLIIMGLCINYYLVHESGTTPEFFADMAFFAVAFFFFAVGNALIDYKCWGRTVALLIAAVFLGCALCLIGGGTCVFYSTGWRDWSIYFYLCNIFVAFGAGFILWCLGGWHERHLMESQQPKCF